MQKHNERLFLDIHVIQTLPPANINRDDTGSPKTCQYGGVTRARVSSQSWKRAVRKYFLENGERANVGARTVELGRYVAEKIVEMNGNDYEDAFSLAVNVLEKAIKNKKEKIDAEGKTKALFFISDAQARALAQLAIDGETDEKKLNAALHDNPSIDIALFGRMVASDPTLNEDASSQVAHAISTHKVETEFDFFTAVDDLSPEDQSGATMLGTIEFNSSTLYRYANVNLHEFLQQLNSVEKTVAATTLFVEAFIKSLPTGKINTFANQSLPQAVVVTLRADRPVNLVTAFEKPIHAQDGYVDVSVERLYKEFLKTNKMVDAPLFTACFRLDEQALESIGKEEESLSNLMEDLRNELSNQLKEQGEES